MAVRKGLFLWRFNPRPALMPGESEIQPLELYQDGFQSTPGINAGRIGKASDGPACAHGFNPRPALMPGESMGSVVMHLSQKVSIHARH